jgi:hypothetical protein
MMNPAVRHNLLRSLEYYQRNEMNAWWPIGEALTANQGAGSGVGAFDLAVPNKCRIMF